jgi:ABC-type transport system involved in cytochrome c biogenesis permease subunit
MAIKYSMQGLLIYLVIATYLIALVISVLGKKGMGRRFYQIGFVIAVLAFAYRWYSVRHVPLQNLFEVFLGMGILVYPLSLFSRRVLRVGGEAADMLIGAILLVPPGFIFDAAVRKLPPALQCWLFGPHVAVYLLAYVIMAKATVQAFPGLIGKTDSQQSDLVPYEEGTYRLVCFGFPLLTLGLIMGSWWGKLAWGDYWGWGLSALAIHVRKKARPYEQHYSGHWFRCDCDNAALGEPIKVVCRPAQLCPLRGSCSSRGPAQARLARE